MLITAAPIRYFLATRTNKTGLGFFFRFSLESNIYGYHTENEIIQLVHLKEEK